MYWISKMTFWTHPGLNLELFLEQDEYAVEVTHGLGARIVVHPSDRMPFPEDHGILISPGADTHIGIMEVYM